MLTVRPKIFQAMLVLTSLFALVGALWPQLPAGLEVSIFLALMILTGIPHGATDHLVYQYEQRAEGRQVSWGKFLLGYLGTMLAYGCAWVFFPGLSLTAFLLMSAYHFGQSQVLYLGWNNDAWPKRLLGLAWGVQVLSTLLLWHWPETLRVIETLVLVPDPLRSPDPFWMNVWIGSWLLLVLTGFGFALRSGAMRPWQFGRELLTLVVLGAAFWWAGLWLGFAIYFAGWHSLSSMLAEIDTFRRDGQYSWRAFVRDALPLTLISLFGIGLLLLAGWLWGEAVSPALLFFIAISVLTLPHMYHMEQLYRRRSAAEVVAG